MSWLKYIRATSIVIDDSNGKYFESHHLLEVTFGPLLLYCLLELSDAVVVFICQLPPVRAKLGDVVDFLSFQTIYEL
jgi:hypothetical protein